MRSGRSSRRAQTPGFAAISSIASARSDVTQRPWSTGYATSRTTSTRSALLLALGRCGIDQLPEVRRSELTPELLALYRDAPDPAVHAAAGWLLRTWRRSAEARAAVAGLATGRVRGTRRWYLNREGQTLALLAGEAEFHMGSPDDEPWRRNNETRRIVRVRPFDLATTEVTVGEFRAFVDQTRRLRERYAASADADPGLPQNGVTWYDAVAYCNWLSEREGLPRAQWCYEPNSEGDYAEGMRIVADVLSRTGYRLPTESEWEYACRAGTVTSRSFGDSAELILRYACCLVNSADRPLPAGSLMPNPFGLFDMHGNLFEWCQDGYEVDDESDPPGEDIVSDRDDRLVRGGGYLSHPPPHPVGRALQGCTDPPQRYGGLPPGPQPAGAGPMRGSPRCKESSNRSSAIWQQPAWWRSHSQIPERAMFDCSDLSDRPSWDNRARAIGASRA